MKKIIISYFLFSIFNISLSYSQNYIPIPDSSAYWRLSDATALESFRVDSVKNDTNINTIDYVKLFYYSYYIGAYRNDTVGKKIFFIPVDSIQEYLLYDFSLKVNDSVKVIRRKQLWPAYPLSFVVVQLLVDSLTNKTIGPKIHKRIFLKNLSYLGFVDYMWTEGVGSDDGIISYSEYPGPYLYCMSYKDTVYYFYNFQLAQESNYFQGRCDTIDIQLSINENLPLSEIQISPSPANASLKIKSSDKNIFPLQITMYNSLGILCKYFVAEEDKPLDIFDLPNGMYFLQIHGKSKIYKSQKIMKQ